MQEHASAVCDVCGADFPNDDLLRDHRLTHENRCPVCGSEFTTEALLADHRRTHGGGSDAGDADILERQGERKP